MPTGPIHDEQSDRSGRHAQAYFGQMLVHGLGIDCWQDQTSANTTGRADSAEEIDPGEALIARGTRAAAAPSPSAGERALLADPCFILKPDLDKLIDRAFTKGSPG